MKRIFYLILVIAGFTLVTAAQEEMRMMRFPAIHGDQVVFSYAGDLYSVEAQGGIARRLTSHQGYEMFPRFSPDGKKIAFTGQYDGNTEVYIIPSSGGLPQRLTHTATLSRDDISDRMGPNNIVMTWTPDGEHVIFRSRDISFNDFVGVLYRVSADGGLPQRLPLSTGGFCSWSPDGKKLAFNRVMREFRTWKYYQGGMADDIRIFDTETKEIVNITNHIAQDIFPMWHNTKIFFLSDRDRTMNLFVYDLVSQTTRKVTHFTDYDIKFPSIGTGKIIFEQAGYLHILDAETEKITRMEISIADDLEPGRLVRKDVSKTVREASLAPDGKRVVVSARGDIFTVPAEHGITRNLTNTSGSHERSAVWSPDGKYIAYLSDQSGEYQIYIREQSGATPARRITNDLENYVYSISWSPDSRMILFNDRNHNLQYVTIETGNITPVAHSGIWEITQFSWSPDSKWITFAQPMKSGMNQIMLYELSTGKTHEVTQPWHASGSPVFSDDGKYLAFVSNRDFSPIYSSTEWNHAYRNMSRVYLITLDKTTANPFRERNDEVSMVTDSKDEAVKLTATGKKGKKGVEDIQEDKASNVVNIDIDGIQDRLVALPIRPSGYYNINIVNNRIYYNENYFGESGTRLMMYDLERREESELGKNMGYSLSFNNKQMLVRSGGSYYVIGTPTGKIKTEKAVNFSNMAVQTNLLQEYQQIYTESWRQMRDFFYDPQMHGNDWQAMHDKYAVLVPYVSNRNDLNYLIGELIGELNVGHAYVSGGDKYTPERVQTGLLGINVEKDATGYWKITRILEGQNWDSKLVSPLTQVGVKVQEGDYIIAIDGIDLQDIDDMYSVLTGKANTVIELTINQKPSKDGARKEIVRTIADESGLYYHQWVTDNIRKVSEATDGRVGYLHIPDMVQTGLNEFVKYYYPQLYPPYQLHIALMRAWL
jgi:tricorn protease